MKEQAIAEDIVSEMFINLWEKRKQIVIQGNVKTYLYIAVKNRGLNYLRDNKTSLYKFDSVDRITLTMSDSPDDKVNLEDLKSAIDELIDELPEKRKLIFQMCRFDELTYKEIADILMISESTVKNQMMKAVKFMNAGYPALRKIFPI